MRKIKYLIFLLLISGSVFSQTGVINNGVRLVISQNAKLDINGGESAQYVHNQNAILELNGQISLEGNWLNNSGSPDVFTMYGENAQVVMDGTQGQTFGGTTATNFTELTVNGLLELNSDLNLPENLTMNTGIILLGNHNLILGENSEIVTETAFSNENMIVTNGTGSLIRKIEANGTYVFPVGDTTGIADYSPVSINLTASQYNNAQISVQAVNSKQPNNTNTTNYLNRYWHVSQNGITGMNSDIELAYVLEDVVGINQNISTKMWNGTEWINLNASQNNTLSGNVSEYGSFTGFGTGSSINDNISVEDIYIVVIDNQIVVRSKIDLENTQISVYNFLGQTISNKQLCNGTSNSVSIGSLKQGNYLIRISGSNIDVTKKIFVQ